MSEVTIQESSKKLVFIEPHYEGDGVNTEIRFKKANMFKFRTQLTIDVWRDAIYGKVYKKTKKLVGCKECGHEHYKTVESRGLKEDIVCESIELGMDHALLLRDKLNEWFDGLSREIKHSHKKTKFSPDKELLERLKIQ